MVSTMTVPGLSFALSYFFTMHLHFSASLLLSLFFFPIRLRMLLVFIFFTVVAPRPFVQLWPRTLSWSINSLGSWR